MILKHKKPSISESNILHWSNRYLTTKKKELNLLTSFEDLFVTKLARTVAYQSILRRLKSIFIACVYLLSPLIGVTRKVQSSLWLIFFKSRNWLIQLRVISHGLVVRTRVLARISKIPVQYSNFKISVRPDLASNLL